MAADEGFPHKCWICSKEVQLEIAKTDEHGRVVHEHCYALRMQLNGASSSAGANHVKLRPSEKKQPPQAG